MGLLKTSLTNLYYGTPLYNDERLMLSTAVAGAWTLYRYPDLRDGQTPENGLQAATEFGVVFWATPFLSGLVSIIYESTPKP